MQAKSNISLDYDSWESTACQSTNQITELFSPVCPYPGDISCRWGISPSSSPGTQAWIDADQNLSPCFRNSGEFPVCSCFFSPSAYASPGLNAWSTSRSLEKESAKRRSAALAPWVVVWNGGYQNMRKVFQLKKHGAFLTWGVPLVIIHSRCNFP